MKELGIQVIIYFNWVGESFLCSIIRIHFSYFGFVSILYSLYNNHLEKVHLTFLNIFQFTVILECLTWHLRCAHSGTPPNSLPHPTCIGTGMDTVAAMFGVPLPPPGSSWDLPLLILCLPPVKCFLLSQNCSSKYFMKQLDRSLSVVLACPKASKMDMTCSKVETFTELLILKNKTGEW